MAQDNLSAQLYNVNFDGATTDKEVSSPTKGCRSWKYAAYILIICLICSVGFNIFMLVVHYHNGSNGYPYSPEPTKEAALPGVYYMNRAYNLLSGQELYVQDGHEVISYQWDGRTTSPVQDRVYEIPIEFQSVPNIAPSCEINTRVNDVYYSASSSVLTEQSASSSHGFSQNVDLSAGFNVDGFEANAKTSITNALLWGQSTTSKSGRRQTSSDYSWSFSLDTLSTWYKAAINWNNKHINFIWKPSFIDSLQNINEHPTNKTILSFFNSWGSHLLQEMQTGSYCKETAYSSSTATKTQVYDFQQHVASKSSSFVWWSWDSSSSSKDEHSGTYNNEVDYTFSDIYCKGEIDVSSACGGLTGKTNAPVVTSYVLKPIWEIDDVTDRLHPDSLKNINLFIQHLFDSLSTCSQKYCNSSGHCTLNENIWSDPDNPDSFINNWNGTDFSQLWKYDDTQNDNTYCFCDPGFYGNNCSLLTNCDCYGETGCCCYKPNYLCNPTLLCNPTNLVCMNSDSASIQCGKYGKFMQCEQGVITSVCGSGSDADCSSSVLCPSNSWNGIKCNYPALGVYSDSINDLKVGGWFCGHHGVCLDCLNSPNTGDLMIGLCGSGENADCKEYCSGYAGILCASIKGVSIDETECEWLSQDNWGRFMSCNNGSVATGYCGSGGDKNCDGHAFQVKCCRLNYP